MTCPRPICLAPLLVVAMGLPAGCGYSAGFGLAREGVTSIGVEIVTNETFRQRLEIPLTRQLQREIEARAGVETASPSRADAVLRVWIRSAREYPLGEGARGEVVVGSLVLAVEAQLTHRRTGRVLRRGRLADRGEFILPAGEVYEDAAEEASAKIARRVVLLMDPQIATLMGLRGAEPGPPRPSEGQAERIVEEEGEAGQRPETERPLDT